MDDDSGASRAFLPRVAGERCDDTGYGFVEICRFIDDNGIFPAHLGNHPLDHRLSSAHARCFG